MARKNYSEEFRRQAVDLYESTPGATVRGIAEDLGIERGTLRHWLERHGILARPMAAYGLPHCVRITVGRESENQAVVERLREFLA